MKRTMLVLAAMAVPLAACGGKGDDRLADRVEDAADNRADALEMQSDRLESQAEALDERAEQVRKTGERRADAIDAADPNAKAMSGDRKDMIAANEAAAVR